MISTSNDCVKGPLSMAAVPFYNSQRVAQPGFRRPGMFGRACHHTVWRSSFALCFETHSLSMLILQMSTL